MDRAAPDLRLPPAALGPGVAAVVEDLLAQLHRLRAEMLAAEEEGLGRGRDVHLLYRQSAQNLLHYLAIRRRDLRPLQGSLAALGLSSLGRSEPQVLANLDAVLGLLHRLAGRPWTPPAPRDGVLPFGGGDALLTRHAVDLLGPERPGRRVRILVTLPTEAADDSTVASDLLHAGMDCARINCAHDDAAAWGRMIAHLRAAEAAAGRRCRVLMDLAGPKLRTGPVAPGPAVRKLRPVRDACGNVLAPAAIRIRAHEGLPATADPRAPEPALALPGGLLALLAAGDELDLADARGAQRTLRVVAVAPGEAQATCDRTTYVVPGLEVRARRGAKALGRGPVGPIDPKPGALRLLPGDVLEVTRSLEPGRDARRDGAGRVLDPARIGCTLPAVLSMVRPGEAVWFDDGRAGGVVREASADRMRVEITHARAKGERLGADRGINLPDSRLELDAIGPKDVEDLAFVAAHADAVALSFVRSPADVNRLEEHLRRLGRPDLGIVLKIETRAAFERLPDLLLSAMRSPCAGVMIARGDLAVECGWERLAEIQEEILWICEAAHVPVVWATQVLEGLAKEGRPSRAEITDAAMGERAECVMLNKGPHLAEAVRALDDILRRMQEHQRKKRAMLRPLRIAGAAGGASQGEPPARW